MSCLLEVLNEHGRAEHSPISRENRPLKIPRANTWDKYTVCRRMKAKLALAQCFLVKTPSLLVRNSETRRERNPSFNKGYLWRHLPRCG